MKRILAIFAVILFIIPISVIAVPNSIKVGDLINVEKVIWVSDNVDDKVAYVTSELKVTPFNKKPIPPIPIIKFVRAANKVTGYDINGSPMFSLLCKGIFVVLFTFFANVTTKILAIIPLCEYSKSPYYRCFGTVTKSTSGQGTDCGKLDMSAVYTHYSSYTFMLPFGFFFGGDALESYGINAWISYNEWGADGGGSFWLIE